jgi:hypothetical protein
LKGGKYDLKTQKAMVIRDDWDGSYVIGTQVSCLFFSLRNPLTKWNNAPSPAKSLDMSILVSDQCLKKQTKKKLKNSRRKRAFHREPSSPFCISGLILPALFFIILFLHRGGIATSIIDLALMRERYPVVFYNWGKALCCQSTRWT